jgi:riboflavin kinase
LTENYYFFNEEIFSIMSTTNEVEATTAANNHTMIQRLLPIRMISTVIHGYGRGSKDLGIPTANLDLQQLISSCTFDDLPTGIYWGYARIVNNHTTNNNNNEARLTTGMAEDVTVSPTSIQSTTVYPTAISIGYNPTYGNSTKTIEPHLIAAEDDPCRHASCTGETLFTNDFYDTTIRLSIIDYIRPELPFQGLELLIEAIKNDIKQTQTMSQQLYYEPIPSQEIKWIQSDDPPIS